MEIKVLVNKANPGANYICVAFDVFLHVSVYLVDVFVNCNCNKVYMNNRFDLSLKYLILL